MKKNILVILFFSLFTNILLAAEPAGEKPAPDIVVCADRGAKDSPPEPKAKPNAGTRTGGGAQIGGRQE